MRLWSLHPSLLDARGLVALWREALLAQHVLRGKTRGYRQHPQLQRFRRSSNPTTAIACYLRAIHEEAERRGYSFDKSNRTRCSSPSPARLRPGNGSSGTRETARPPGLLLLEEK